MKHRRPPVASRRRGNVAEVVLDLRADGGRLTPAAAGELRTAFDECHDAWVVLLRSVGPDFCLGLDEREPWPELATLDFVSALAAVPAPVVVSLRGRVEAEGFELALAADVRVAAPDATFRMPQVGRGRVPRHGGTQRLPRMFGVERALRMILLDEPVPARRALDWGLVARVAVSPDRRARALVDELATRGPIALRLGKEAVVRAGDFTLDDGARFEHDLYVLLQTTRDRAEGVRAFLDKRRPKFVGR